MSKIESLDQQINMTEAAALLSEVTGRRQAPQKLRGWITNGLRSYKLEGSKLGGEWMTTAKDMLHFVEFHNTGNPIELEKELSRQEVETKAALGTDAGATGGYAVAPPAVPSSLATIAPFSGFAKFGIDVTPSSNQREVDVPVFTPGSSADPINPLGGTQFTWTADTDIVTDVSTTPSLGRRRLISQLVRANVTVSNTLLADAPAMKDITNTQLLRALAFNIDGQFLQGDGLNKPLGVINNPASLAVNRANAGTIAAADVAGLLAALLTGGDMSKVFFYCSPSALAKIAQLPAFEVSARSTNADQLTIAGRPLYVSHFMADLGTKGDLVALNGTLWANFVRMPPTVEQSTQIRFLTNETVFRIAARVAGGLLANKPYAVTATTSLAAATILN